MVILQAIKGMMEMMREDRQEMQERRAQQQIEERALHEDEEVIDLVEQERKLEEEET